MAGRARGLAAAPPVPPQAAFPREPFRLGSLEIVKEEISSQKFFTESIREKCGACGAADGSGVRLRACDACDAVRYCDRECQLSDWPAHVLACKILASDREVLVRVGVSGSRNARVLAPCQRASMVMPPPLLPFRRPRCVWGSLEDSFLSLPVCGSSEYALPPFTLAASTL